MSENTIFCQVEALSPDNRVIRTKLANELLKKVRKVEELKNGYAFRYPLDTTTLMKIAEFTDFERRCCPFFTFQIEINPGKDSIRFLLTGDKGVKDFIQSHEDFAA